MKVLEDRKSGKQLPIVSEPEKLKPFYTIRNEDGTLEQKHATVTQEYGQYEVKTLDRKYPRGRF